MITRSSTERSGLDRLFQPRSIALVGVSPDDKKISGRPFHFLRRFGYAGRVHLVNPRYEELHGLPVFASIGKVAERVDLAIITTPAKKTEALLEECAEASVGSAIVYAGGFGEFSADGAASEERLRSIARGSGLRLLGPNCQGFVNLLDGICATFNAAFSREGPYEPGGIAWVGQSGALGGVAYDLFRRANLRLNLWVSTGNEADLTNAEAMAMALEQETSTMACGYVEAVRDPELFLAMAARAEELGKPVVLIKGGLTSSGAAAISTHTGLLAGEEATYRAFFRQAGVILAEDVRDLVAIASVAGTPPRNKVRGRRVAIIGNSGGMNAVTADFCEMAGLPVPPLGAEAEEVVRAQLPVFIRPANPVDFQQGVFTNPARAARLVSELHAAGGHDVFFVVVHSIYDDIGYDSQTILSSLAGAATETGALVVLVALNSQDDFVLRANALGLPAFDDMKRAVTAVAALVGPSENLGRPAASASAAPPSVRPVGEHDAKRVLARHGFPIVPGRFAASEQEAAASAAALGYPVVVKVVASGLIHKTEVGGVVLNVTSAEDAAKAYRTVVDAIRTAHPESPPTGVLVERQLQGVEVVLGMRRDQDLGPVVMFGLGGVTVELLEDMSLRVGPLTPDQARRMILETKASALLTGHRGSGPADMDAVVDLLVRLSEFVQERTALLELDLNPVVVLPAGEGAFVLDAVMLERD